MSELLGLPGGQSWLLFFPPPASQTQVRPVITKRGKTNELWLPRSNFSCANFVCVPKSSHEVFCKKKKEKKRENIFIISRTYGVRELVRSNERSPLGGLNIERPKLNKNKTVVLVYARIIHQEEIDDWECIHLYMGTCIVEISAELLT